MNGPRRLCAIFVASTVLLAGCGSGTPRSSDLVARGQEIAGSRCISCHSTDGSPRVGPTWQGLAGSEVRLHDGTTVIADDDYLARSITDPQADRVAGFPARMPALGLSDDDVAALIAYIRSLGR